MSMGQLLIAGGGIGGLAAALAAARAGWEVRLFERARQFSEVGAGVQLGPNVTRVLRDWGLEDDLRAVAAFPQGLRVRNALDGALLAELPLGEHAEQRYGAPYATIHRADLHELLRRAAERQDGVRLYLDHQLTEFADDGQAVQLTTTTDKVVAGDALVGADGVFSRVRQQLLGDGPPLASGHLAYRAMLAQSALPRMLRTRYVTAWLGPGLHVVQFPVRRSAVMNLVAIVQGQHPDDLEKWDHHANAADLQGATEGVCAHLRALIAAASATGLNEHAWRLWALVDRPPLTQPEQMARGLVALLGDAAHPMRPYLAQGAGMAIEDAAELAHALGMDVIDLPTRLHRYALARWQRVARVQAQAQRNGRIYHADGALRWGRDAALRLLGQRLLDQPWLYGQ
jgi:salicylate hydroxylase